MSLHEAFCDSFFPFKAALVSILSSLQLCAKLGTQEGDHMPMQLILVIIHSWDNQGVSRSLYVTGSRTLLDFGITKLGYKCHENRLSGKISNITASSLNQI